MRYWMFLFFLFSSCCTLHAFNNNSMEHFDYEAFHQKFEQPTPDWMTRQINHDLAPFQGKLSKSDITKFFVNYPKMTAFRVIVKKNRLKIVVSYAARKTHILPQIISYIKKLHKIKPLPDVDFIVSTIDVYYHDDKNTAYPVFIVSKDKFDKGFILIPDWTAMDGHFNEKTECQKGALNYPWESKLEKIFWRGGSSGILTAIWQDSPRPQLIFLSYRYPEYLDAKFVWTFDSMKEIISGMGMLSNSVPICEHLKYKYLIDVDGWSCTWPRLYWILLSNSVLLKHDSDNIQWFYSVLEPNKHYIPIARDFSDLFQKFKWAQEHDAKCKEISENATNFAKEYLTQENSFFYYYKAIEAYAKLQKECY